MIVGGLVAETNPSEILAVIEEQQKIVRSESELGTAAAAAQQRLDQLAGSLSALQGRVGR